MSRVTDVIVCTAIEDGAEYDDTYPNVDLLNAYLKEKYNGFYLNKLDDKAEGNKALQCDLFVGAFNRFNKLEFYTFFKTIDWEYPESVQLLIKEEDDHKFSIYSP